MKKPTNHQVFELVETVRKVDWKDIERRLSRALERNAVGGSSQPDGFPSSTMGGGSSGGDTSDPTYLAVWARDKAQRDDLAENVQQAVGFLEQAAMSVNALRVRLDNIDKVGLGIIDRPAWCQPHKAAGIERAPEHRGTVGGALDRDTDLCGDCYSFVSRNRTLPTTEQVKHHEDTGRWRVRSA